MMGISFGDVRPKELSKRTGLKFTAEEMKVLEEHYSPNANPPAEGKGWHVTDLPIMCAHVCDGSIDAVVPILLRAAHEHAPDIAFGISPCTMKGKKRIFDWNRRMGSYFAEETN